MIRMLYRVCHFIQVTLIWPLFWLSLLVLRVGVVDVGADTKKKTVTFRRLRFSANVIVYSYAAVR